MTSVKTLSLSISSFSSIEFRVHFATSMPNSPSGCVWVKGYVRIRVGSSYIDITDWVLPPWEDENTNINESDLPVSPKQCITECKTTCVLWSTIHATEQSCPIQHSSCWWPGVFLTSGYLQQSWRCNPASTHRGCLMADCMLSICIEQCYIVSQPHECLWFMNVYNLGCAAM